MLKRELRLGNRGITSYTQLHMSTTAYRFAQPNPNHFPWWFRLVHLPHNLPITRHFLSSGFRRVRFFFSTKNILHLSSWGGQDISNLLQVEGGRGICCWLCGGDSSWGGTCGVSTPPGILSRKILKNHKGNLHRERFPTGVMKKFGTHFCWVGIKPDWC